MDEREEEHTDVENEWHERDDDAHSYKRAGTVIEVADENGTR